MRFFWQDYSEMMNKADNPFIS